jgi:biotin transport system substrate-specific component
VITFTGIAERQRSGLHAGLSRAAKLAAFVCLTTAAAQFAVRFPFTPVPVTMQTLFVVLAGVTLGPRDGFCAMLAYVAIGFAGAPVFAEFSGGPHVLLGPTGGYLVAFPAAALAAGYVSRALGGGRPAVLAASLCGMALILLSGASYLALISAQPFARAASLAILPFVAGELVKAFVASGLAGARLASRGGIF